MTQVEKNMAVEALAQLLDQQPTAYAEVLAACRAMGWNASPTAQPADIIDELPSNVLPFIRRMLALLIYGDGSSDSPAVVPVTERLYAQMLARQASPNYPAAGFPTVPSAFSPMTPSIRDFAHIEQALAALSARKITNGNATNGGAPSDGIPDGMSLAHILGDSSVVVTKLVDDNVGWTWNRALPSIFSGLTKLRLSCAYIQGMTTALPTSLQEIEFPELLSYGLNSESRPLFIYNNPNITELTFPKAKAIGNGFTYDSANNGCFISSCSNLRKVTFTDLEKYGEPLPGHGSYADAYGCLIHSCANLEEVLMPKWTGVRNWRIIRNCPKVWKVVLGNITSGVPSLYGSTAYPFSSCVKLRHLEFAGVQVSLDLSSWNPDAETLAHEDFLPNFKNYIALRLTDNGGGKTLTLSQAVFDTIWNSDGTPKSTDPDSVIYQINKIIKTDKYWSVNRA